MKDIGILAKEWYDANNENLAHDILRCFFRGAIIKHPNFILLGEPCRTEGKVQFLEGEPDTWWVYYWGATKEQFSCFDVADAAPFYLPYIAFKRRGKMRIRRWEDFLRQSIKRRELAEVT